MLKYRLRYWLLCAALVLCHTLQAQLRADFTATPTSGCVPLRVTFTDQSAGGPDRWLWDLGDGVVSTEKDPTRLFLRPGRYDITLTVFKGAQSSTITKPGFVVAHAIPTVNFSANITGGCIPLDVQFTDNSVPGSGSLTDWRWDFGDGNLGTGKTVTHTYQTEGNFKVTLTARNSEGCENTFSIENYISVSKTLRAKFELDYTPKCDPPLTVQFRDISIGTNINSYLWDFGDGFTSTQKNPTHTYQNRGAYGVKLTVTNADGCTNTYQVANAVNVANLKADFSVPGLVCAGALTAFNNLTTPTVDVDSVIWKISDGRVVRSKNLFYSFPNPGSYSIEMEAYQYGCKSTVTKSFNVLPRPKASFTSSGTTACKAPLSVSFQNTSSNARVVTWDFGNGRRSTEETPSVIFDSIGSYTVRLVVINASGCYDTLVEPAYVNVLPPSIDSIRGLPYDGCGPYTNTFVPRITTPEPVVSYAWDFGDGNRSTLPNPSNTYNSNGLFVVTLNIVTQNGCIARDTQLVRISPRPKADFSGSPNRVCPSVPVAFKDLSTGTINAWEWKFGDGGTSSLKNPDYKYNDTGYMNVALIVYNNGCADTMVKASYVYVDPPLANFEDSVECADQRIHYFTNRSFGADRWQWNFGDGNSSTDLNPTHTFTDTGMYNVSLYVEKGTCNHTFTLPVYVLNQKANVEPVYIAGCKSSVVELTATGPSTFPSRINKYEWRIPNETPFETDTNFIKRSFSDTTTFLVGLKITDLNNCADSVLQPVKIILPESKAKFLPEIQLICANSWATFTDSSQVVSTNPIKKWTWYFDHGVQPDEDSVMLQPPFRYQYTKAGVYDVKMIVEDSFGCVDSILQKGAVRVFGPRVSFESPDTLVCLNTPVRFKNTSGFSAYPPTWKWEFGDGRTSDQEVPTLSYSQPGVYDITLVLTDGFGCSDTLVKPRYIAAAEANALFEMSDSFATCPPFLVQFTNQSSSNAKNFWDFGNGNSSTLINPAHTYNASGDFTVTLRVEGNGGCSDSTSRRVSIRGPQGQISYTPLTDCAPLTVEFTSQAVNTQTYVWDFSDGITRLTSTPSVSHTYHSPGSYVPRVVLEDGKGCKIPILGLDTIIVKDTPVVVAGPNPIACLGQTVNLNATGAISYNWDAHPTLSCLNCATPAVTPTGATVYRVSGTDAFGCVGTDTALVRVMLPGTLSVSLGDTLCVGESVSIRASGFDRYAWSPATGLNNPSVPNPIARPAVTTNYVVTATDTLGCFTATGTVPVVVYPIPRFDIIETVIKANVGSVIPIKSSVSADVSKYLWSPALGLSCSTCPEPFVTVERKATYTATVMNDGGCVAQDLLSIEPTCTGESIFIPNTFSPNGDGSNDVFYPRGSGISRIKYMQIFNRWGEMVYERKDFVLNDPTAGWNGTYKGQQLTPDVYVYMMEVICGNNETFTKRGNVTLIK